jgi:hypothetical protein
MRDPAPCSIRLFEGRSVADECDALMDADWAIPLRMA